MEIDQETENSRSYARTTSITPSTSTAATATDSCPTFSPWSPSGIWWRDFLHFVGPGWFVSIAYVDPGNYQADIQAGATSRYSLLCILWWTSLLSMYVQVLCVRLSYYSNMTLAEAQARTMWHNSNTMRYLAWAIAEFSTVITDLPEVIGIGIACHVFFGWDYYVGVLLSLLTTMVFLATMNCGMRVLETIIVAFVGLMSIALFVELDFVQPNPSDLLRGWAVGFLDFQQSDIFAMTGVVGAVVMPHNLYLHTAAVQSRPALPAHVKQAVRYSSLEPVVPILVSFAVNLAIVAIAAETVHGQDGAEAVGLTDFCTYFQKLSSAGCVLWAVALLAAGQSSAITTTFAGQHVMDGFLQLALPVSVRAIATRLVAIAPCVIVSLLFPNDLNGLVNTVNSGLSLLLPFAFSPLVKFNCSAAVMGPEGVARGVERWLLHAFAAAVWLINALALSTAGGGFLGDARAAAKDPLQLVVIVAAEVAIQAFYAWWNWNCLARPLMPLHTIVDQSNDEDEAIETATPRTTTATATSELMEHLSTVSD